MILSFPDGFSSEADGWGAGGRRLTETDLKLVQAVLEREGPVLLKHWFYGGASAPECHLFGEIGPLREYLKAKVLAGDALRIWSVEKLLEQQGMVTVVSCKCANGRGEVPSGGAYGVGGGS